MRNTDSDRDSLHGHMLLVRMKLAAGLAILHGTTNVSDVLWEASGHVIDLSTATLDIVLEHARKKAAKEATAKGHAAAIADEVKEERKLVQVARRIGSYVARNSRDGTARHARQSNSRWGGIRRWSMAESRRQSTSDTSRNGKTTRSQAGDNYLFYVPGR